VANRTAALRHCPAGRGVGAGALGAVAVDSALASLLFDVQARDPDAA